MIEKVNPMHPDKQADRIAGVIVDMAYAYEANPKIAVEVLIGHGKAHIIIESSIGLDALTAFGLTAKDFGHFADIMAAASSNANTNVAMMGETLEFQHRVEKRTGAVPRSEASCAMRSTRAMHCCRRSTPRTFSPKRRRKTRVRFRNIM